MATSLPKRNVPWFSRSELLSLYEELFSGRPLLQKHAINRVSVWKCRFLHRLSIAFECTCELISACLFDEETGQLSTQSDQDIHNVRLTYSMSIVRFVNLITERFQSRFHSAPVYTLAEELGIPEWIVNLRHNATHSGLPSLAVLRAAAEFSLIWIKDNFWDEQIFGDLNTGAHNEVCQTKQKLSVETTDVDPTVEHDTFLLLQKYVHFAFMKKTHLNNKEKNAIDNEVQSLTERFQLIATAYANEALKSFILDGYFLSTVQQCEQLDLSSNDFINNLSSSPQLRLPEALVVIWRPLLKSLHKAGVTTALLHSLCQELSERDSFRNKLLACWIAKIIAECSGKSRDRSKLFDSPVSETIDTRNLVKIIFSKPNTCTYNLLKKIFICGESGFRLEQEEQLIECIKCYINRNTCKPHDNNNQPILTLEDAVMGSTSNELLLSNDTEQGKTIQKSTNRWSLSSADVDWSLFPLGTCPYSTVTYNNLELKTKSAHCSQHSNEDNEMTDDINNRFTQSDVYDVSDTEMGDSASITHSTKSLLADKNLVQRIEPSIQLFS